MKVLSVVGARPEFVQECAVSRALPVELAKFWSIPANITTT